MTEPLPVQSTPPPVDPRPRRLLERYCSLTGALLLEVGDGLLEFEVPPAERHHWGDDPIVKVALVPDAMTEDPDADLLGVGSPAFERLVTAIRTRGFRVDNGLVPPTHDSKDAERDLPIPVESAVLEQSRSELSVVPVGRLLVRVSIKAGSALEERLVESPPVDLSTGTRVPDDLVSALTDASSPAPAAEPPAEAIAVAPRLVDDLLPLVFDELEGELREQLTKVGGEAERALHQELERLDRYYAAMVADLEDEAAADAADAKRAIRADHARRRGEEEERARVRISVHPLQLLEWRVLGQRVTWSLATPDGVIGTLAATRLLTGDSDWRLTCPTCGTRPTAVRVCREGHVSCPGCSGQCLICEAMACVSHGLSTCVPGGHQVCSEHRLTCRPCGRVHCSRHAAYCDAGDHDVCPECAVACANCGAASCRQHAVQTGPNVPRGQRWLCESCTVLCEDSQTEPVGKDEAVRCVACERYVCEQHRSVCVVDGAVHCSRHLRRSDHSGRLACEVHRGACAGEPDAILASDEVQACATCEKSVCDRHGGPCLEDGQRHCNGHLAAVADRPGTQACERHRTTCHVDGVSYSLAGARPCPACGKPACERHRVACPSCARQVCQPDVDEGLCRTCSRLEPTGDPPDDLIQAAIAVQGGEPFKAKRWRTARDASSTVVELDLGWTRRVIFTVLHGDTKPKTAVQHSVLGSKRLR